MTDMTYAESVKMLAPVRDKLIELLDTQGAMDGLRFAMTVQAHAGTLMESIMRPYLSDAQITADAVYTAAASALLSMESEPAVQRKLQELSLATRHQAEPQSEVQAGLGGHDE